MNKIIITFIISIFCSCSGFAANTDSQIANYVDELVSKTSALLNDRQISEEEKVTSSRRLIAENLDLEWMAKYTLGRHRRELSAVQINDFIKIYSTYIVKTYANLVRNYKGEKAMISKVIKLDNLAYIVKTEVIKHDQPPTKVDYFVRTVATANSPQQLLKISDVITEGVSMVNSQQAEFSSIIKGEGFAVLLLKLKAKF